MTGNVNPGAQIPLLLAHFKARVAETIEWIRRRPDIHEPAVNLRSPELKPLDFFDTPARARLSKLIVHEHAPLADIHCQREVVQEERNDIVELLCEQRAKLLRELGERSKISAGSLVGGRLLVYDPDANLADGAACTETGQFFDDNNVPPWDTWVMWIREPAPYDVLLPWVKYLVCWTPPDLVELADQGIRVNPEGCIQWMNSIDQDRLVRFQNEDPDRVRRAIAEGTSFTHLLRQEGLIGPL